MKKIIFIFILLFNFQNVLSQNPQIVVMSGSTDVCYPSGVLLGVINTPPGYDWYWEKFIDDCSYFGMSLPFGPPGTTLYTQSSGQYVCVGLEQGGPSVLVTIIPVYVRVLPGNSSLLLPPKSYTGTNCVSSCSLCIPAIYYDGWTGTTINWYKDNTLINGATSGSYTALSSGYYKYSINNNFCSPPSGSDSIYVNILPSVVTTSGATTLCSGGNVLLNTTNIAGITYQWKLNGANISGATTASYSAAASGSYSVVTSSATCSSVSSNSINVTVNPLPTATITPNGTLNFCTEAGITLQANTGAGLTYQWRKNSVNITGGTSSSYLANSTGSFNVVVTNSSGCSKGSTPVNVTSPPSVTITPSGATHFCTGGSVILTSTSGQSVTYKWKKNGSYINGATNSTYTATSTGNYNCVVTNSFGCSKGGTPISVTGPPSAVITANGPTTFCAGGSVQLTAQSGYTYQWIKNSVNFAGATQQNYTATSTGNYKVKVTNAFGCSKTTPNSNQITVSVPCRVGKISDAVVSDKVVKVFPNPFTDELTVSGFEFTLGDKIQLINLLGEVILTEIVKTSTENCKLKTANLHSGIYFLTLQTAAGNKMVKVVKQ